jgi:hypothetical protein
MNSRILTIAASKSLLIVAAFGVLCHWATAQDTAPLTGERKTTAPRRIVVRLTPEVFAPLVERDVDETRPLRDVILNTPVQGKTRTTGAPKLALINDDQCASFIVTLTGATVSRTVGHNGPAVIHSRSVTSFTATKRVVFEPGKGFVAGPAQISARTRIIPEGIGSTRPGLRGRIVERRAAPQVAASRPAAEEIVRQKAMRRVSEAFDHLLEERLERLNRALDLREAIAFVLRGETEPRYSFCTVDGCVQIVAATGPEDALDTVVQLPKLDQELAPVQIWVHKSLVGDVATFFLKQQDQLRKEPGPVMKALAALATGINRASNPDPADATSETNLDYTTAEDWIVVQFQIPQEGTKLGPVAAEPSPRVPASR